MPEDQATTQPETETPAPEPAKAPRRKKAPEVPASGGESTQTPPTPPPDPPTVPPAPDQAGDGHGDQVEARLEKLQTDFARLEADATATKAQLQSAREAMRTQALDALAVSPKFRKFAPTIDDADPTTDEGRAKLEKFAADNPELLIRQPKQAGPALPDPAKVSNPLINWDRWKRARGGA